MLSLMALLALVAPFTVSALYAEGSDVVMLRSDNFEELVMKDDAYWMVEFFAPWCGHCQSLAPEYEKAAKELKAGERAKLGAVDCDAEKELCSKYDVKGFPSLKGFGADNKEKPEEYNGARDQSGIVSFIKERLGVKGGGEDKLAKRLAYGDVYNFMHFDKTPKVILLTKGEKSVPSWFTTIAVKYKEGKKRSIIFAYAKHEDDPGVARNFKVTEFPAMVYVQSEKTDGGHHAVTKAGELGEKASSNIKAGKSFVDKCKAGIAAEEKLAIPSFPPPKRPRKVADTKYAALSEDNINTDCFGGKGTCVIAVVDAPAGDEFKENAMMVELSKKYRNDPFNFVYVDANSQGDFIEAFGLAKGDAPRLVAVKSGKRNRFAVYEGAFEAKKAAEFLDRVLGGDMQFKNIAKLPDFEPEYLRNQKTDDDSDSSAAAAADKEEEGVEVTEEVDGEAVE